MSAVAKGWRVLLLTKLLFTTTAYFKLPWRLIHTHPPPFNFISWHLACWSVLPNNSSHIASFIMDPRPPINPVYAFPPAAIIPAQGTGYFPVPGPSMRSGEPAVHPTPHMYSVPDNQPSLIHTTNYYPNQPHPTSGAYTPEYSNTIQLPYMQHAQHPHLGPHDGVSPQNTTSPQSHVPRPAPAHAVPPSQSSSQAPPSQVPPSHTAPLTSQLSFMFVAESPGNPTTKPKSQPTEPPLHPAPTPVGQGEDKHHIPEGSTVESLLASGFVPPLTAIGDNLPHDESKQIFQALPVSDRKAILAAFLAAQNIMDVDLEEFPIFTIGSAPPPSQLDDPGSGRIPAADKGKQQAPVFTQYCFETDEESHSQSSYCRAQAAPTQPYSDNTPSNVRVLNAVQSVKESVDKRFDDIEDTIETLNVKIESVMTSWAPGWHTIPQRCKPRVRSVAARIAKANGEDFSDQLAAISSDDEMEGQEATAPPERNATRTTAIPVQSAVNQEEENHLTRLAACVRKHFDHEFLHIHTMKDLPVPVPALTEDEAKQYSDARGPVITSCAEFKIDLSRGWKTFRLNQEAADFFITDFLNAVAGGEYSTTPIPTRYLKRMFVASAVSAHVDYLKVKFSKLMKKATPDNKDKWMKELLRRRAATRQQTTSQQCQVLVWNVARTTSKKRCGRVGGTRPS
ncbi:hypothetical protein C8Q74DRAFT_1217087 [Fomes fomentarius]|nr:hypothetical protein C8Q74DRAFT_1217084 [Fomes fomentarius]KAI0779620.1 hypothetical protein C8Q74DRAFT_1217087 [Fomes fomentarius]